MNVKVPSRLGVVGKGNWPVVILDSPAMTTLAVNKKISFLKIILSPFN